MLHGKTLNVRLKDENGGEYMGHVCKNGPVFRSEEVCFDD